MKTHPETPSFLKKYGVYILLFILSAIFFALALLMPLSYGGADDIVHYRFARYSFQHPELLLDHWAKPFFTLLASPFAQLGYPGVKLFNILVGAFTAIILYRMTQLMQLRRNILIIVILFFTPVYTTMLMSGMTEILFAAMLTFAAYLFLRKNYIWAAVAISFLPLVRTEGIVIWPFFAFAFLYHKNWKALPFMLTATIIYSIVGGFYFNDFFWLYTHIPYTGTLDIYGHGELLHFVRSNKAVFGIPVTLLFIAGIIFFIPQKRSLNSHISISLTDAILVILAPILVYYASHSYVWWKGISSYGLLRVMAGVAPLFAIIALIGLNYLVDGISLRILRQLIIAGFTVFVIITPFKVYEIPLGLTEKDKTVKRAAEWFQSSHYRNRKYYMWDNYFYFVQNANPYDTSKMAEGIPDRNQPENLVKPGEIVVWDAHFSAVDGRFPLSSIIDNPFYKLIHVIRPYKPFVAGGGQYQLCFFERLDTASKYNNRNILDSLLNVSRNFKEITLNHQNFEGQKGFRINGNQEYYKLLELALDKQIWSDGDELNISLMSSGKPMILAVSVGNARKARFYQSFSIHKTDSVVKAEFTVLLPEITGKREKLKVYLWNKDKNEAYIRQFEVKLLKL